ncbi:hypothetical protein ACS0TY_011276 [Phlomoides rotata]
MIPFTLTSSSSSSSSVSLSLNPHYSYLPSLKPIHTRYNQLKKLRQQGRLRNNKCRAELSTDAPVALAIGACILNSLIFPTAPPPEDVESESLIDSTDARFAVMGIISFIPFFNWMVAPFSFLLLGVYFGILVSIYSVMIIWYLCCYAELGVCLDGYWKEALCCLCYCLFSSLREVKSINISRGKLAANC